MSTAHTEAIKKTFIHLLVLLHCKLKIAAINEGCDMQDLLAAPVEAYLTKGRGERGSK